MPITKYDGSIEMILDPKAVQEYPSMLCNVPLITISHRREPRIGGGLVMRTCRNCGFKRNIETHELDDDCYVRAGIFSPKKRFGIIQECQMPEKINGFEVGPYCLHWTHYMHYVVAEARYAALRGKGDR